MKDRAHNGQKFEDTKRLIRRHKSMKDREHNGQKFEDTKGVIRRHKSMKDREHNGQKFEDTKGLIIMKDREQIKSLKIPKGRTETENTMAKSLKIKG